MKAHICPSGKLLCSINSKTIETLDNGKWLWLSWLSGCFQYQRSAIQIQSLAKNYLYQTFVYCQLCIEKAKTKEKRPGMVHFFKKIETLDNNFTFEQIQAFKSHKLPHSLVTYCID